MEQEQSYRKRRRHGLRAAAVAGTVCLLCFLLVQTAQSMRQVTGSAWSEMSMAGYRVRIVEEHIPSGEETCPAIQSRKSVRRSPSVKNEGTIAVSVRVSVEKCFGAYREDGTFVTDETLDPEQIRIAFCRKSWFDRGDGYYYYRKLLPAGEMTEEPLFTSYGLSEKAGGEYLGKDMRVDLSLEAVQAVGGEVSLWGMRYRDLGIKPPAAPERSETRISYRGRAEGFVLEGEETSFAAFEDLLPGCTRTQQLRVDNTSGKRVSLLLRGCAARKESMADNAESALLGEQARLELCTEEGLRYRGTLSEFCRSYGADAKEGLFLGEILPGDTRRLTMKLSLPQQMDEGFAGQREVTEWLFAARGALPFGHMSVSDTERAAMWFALLAASTTAMAAAVWIERRSRRRMERK